MKLGDVFFFIDSFFIISNVCPETSKSTITLINENNDVVHIVRSNYETVRMFNNITNETLPNLYTKYESITEIHNCHCDIHDVCNFGCKCGGI